MTSWVTLVKFLIRDNAGDYLSKLQSIFKEEEITLEYMTPYMPQLSFIIKMNIYIH